MANIIISGVDRLIDDIGLLQAFDFLKAPFRKWLFRMQNRIATYPPTIPSGLWLANVSDKQRRAFFALLNSGQIPGGRTGDLGRSWTTQINIKQGEIIGELGNVRPYVRFIQGPDDQVGWAEDRWETTQEVLDMFSDDLIEDIQDEISKIT